MNKTFCSPITAVAILIALFIPIFTIAQEVKKWNFGLSAGLTSECFAVEQKYKVQNEDMSYRYKANSFPNFYTGIWAERKLSSTFSLLPALGYHFVFIDDNILTGGLSKAGSGDDVKESHHYVSLALSLRKYIPLNHNWSLFADAGLKADKLVYFKSEYWRYSNETWKPGSLNNINPALLLAGGIKRGRWALSAEYQYFMGTPLSKEYRANMKGGTEIDVNRKSVGFKALFAIWK